MPHIIEECDICGDEHIVADEEENPHGEPIILLDTGRDTVEGTVKHKFSVLFAHYPTSRRWHELQTLFDRLPDEPNLDTIVYLDDKLDEAVRAEGDLPYNNSDSGAWMIYAGPGHEEEL